LVGPAGGHEVGGRPAAIAGGKKNRHRTPRASGPDESDVGAAVAVVIAGQGDHGRLGGAAGGDEVGGGAAAVAGGEQHGYGTTGAPRADEGHVGTAVAVEIAGQRDHARLVRPAGGDEVGGGPAAVAVGK